MKKLFIPFLVCLVGSFSGFAQVAEICGDGIDNDFDGFIDCFDSDCSDSSDCDGSFLGNDSNCQAEPSEFPRFAMTLDFASPNETTNHLGRIAIGDLDRDGIPEIVSNNRYTDKIFVLNGQDGSVKFERTVDYNPRWEAAIGNINDDGCGEIFLFGDKDDRFVMVAYDCELNELWRDELIADPVNYGLADFDGDGNVELYIKNEIRDAATGTRIIEGSNWNDLNGGPTAVNVLGDFNLELIIGGIVYGVNLGNRSQGSGTLTELRRIPNYERRKIHDGTSVADYNLDGFLDIIATGSEDNQNANTTVFFWDLQTDAVITYTDPIPNLELDLSCQNNTPGFLYQNGWINGTGRVNIADLDGDGNLNASFVSGRFLYALDENFNLLWRVVINEETSGYTGCTLFDFNGDGQSEVVYRDEQFIYIIDGRDGSVLTQQACISRTYREYPIVADVDADGSTELCVPCGFDDIQATDNFCDLGFSRFSHIRVFKSAAEPWVPARRLWNQHGYFVVNVNDDLTIPRFQQLHHLVFSIDSCTVGPNRPLNNFLNQSPFIDSQGCPTYSSPDLAFLADQLTVTPPNCPDRDFTVSYQIRNIGDAELSGNLPISYYDGDPNQPGAVKLATDSLVLSNLGTGDTLLIDNFNITGPGSPFRLFIVLNDNGTTVPSPITLPNTNFLECDYENNILAIDVNPIPFQLSTEITPNVRCIGGSTGTPNNGSARAFRLIGSTEVTADYDFNWFNGTNTSGTPDFVGAIYTGLDSGTYTVFATHKTAQCNSDTVQLTIATVERTISISLNQDAPSNNCVNPNGQLSVSVNGGDPVNNFTYEWFAGNSVGGGLVIRRSHIASDLAPGTYTVRVTDKLTGCRTIDSRDVENAIELPDPDIMVTDIICSDMNSGVLTADVNGSTAGFEFNWYRGNNERPTPDFTGASINGLAQGNYTLIVTNTTTLCSSLPETVTIDQTIAPVIGSISGTDQNSCDPSQPSGTAMITFTGDPADFTVEWFRGQNTNAANLVASGASITDLPQGIYTAKLTDNTTGCFDTEEVTIRQNLVLPNLSTTKTDVTTCNPFDGSITAMVDVGDIADYTFSWFLGSAVKATPDFTETGNMISELAPGDYTVTAINNISNCLVVSPQTVTILDNSPAINITQDVLSEIPPSDCNGNNGRLRISVARAGNSQGFRIEWYAGRAPFSAAALRTVEGVTTDELAGIGAGLYTVVATDLDNGCEDSEEFPLVFANLHEITVSSISASTCVPENGQLDILLDTKGLDEADFIMEIYEGTNPTGTPVETITGVTAQTMYSSTAALQSIEYTTVAINTAPGFNDCESIPKSTIINSVAVTPMIAIDATSTNNNMVCAGGGVPLNGTATIEIDGGQPATDYTIIWYEAQDTATAPLLGTNFGVLSANNTVAQELPGGVYSVEVTNNATGCVNLIPVIIQDVSPIVSLDVTVTNIVRCLADGSPDPGSAVVQVLENGTPVGGYTLAFTDINNVPVADPLSLTAGTYFVSATNGVNGCGSTAEFQIIDEILDDPMVNLVDFQNPTRCLQPNDLGFLEVEAVGNAGATYNYDWFAGSSATGAIILNDSSRLNNVNAGDYTVRVTNNTTGCFVTDTYTLVDEVTDLLIITNSTPIISCDPLNPDGTVFAAVTNSGGNDYTYTWTLPDGSTATQNPLTGLSQSGLYQVTAVDNNDAMCTASTSVSLGIEQIFPNLMVEEIAPLTVCAPTTPNGAARALVDGQFIGYTFEWFEGTDTSVAPFATGPEVSNLQAIMYTVRATDVITLCSTELPITITDGIPPIPVPTIEVLSLVTSCIEANGSLAVSVGGNTSDYIFMWYIGQEVKASADFVGELLTGLDVGFYTVTATSKITGCVSEPVTEEITEELVFPDFNIAITPSTCDEPNGFARLILTNDSDIDIIVWEDANGVQVFGPNLTEVVAGFYTVTVTTPLGCSTSQEIEIKSEINPFNGVSRNGDGQNDIFQISCIDQFPDNIVKIFNRAGTLVYEAEGYDNTSTFFDGVSNKGINVLGNALPDGTYFYVIDKKDGTQPLAGYLELVN